MPDDKLPWRLLTTSLPGLTLTPQAAARLSPLLTWRRLSDGRSLFMQGQKPSAFYAVATGEIETRFTGMDGTVSVIEHVGPPRLFGLAAFAAGLPAEYEAVARGPSEVLVIGREAYTLLMDEVPGFARALMTEFARRYDGTLRLLQAARHQGASERFALALAQLARERGRAVEPGWIEVRATQAELARVAHVSRQTANELLAQAQAAGLVRRGRARWLWRAAGVPPR